MLLFYNAMFVNYLETKKNKKSKEYYAFFFRARLDPNINIAHYP